MCKSRRCDINFEIDMMMLLCYRAKIIVFFLCSYFKNTKEWQKLQRRMINFISLWTDVKVLNFKNSTSLNFLYLKIRTRKIKLQIKTRKYCPHPHKKTRKHSSRMRTTRLPTVRVSVAATNCGQNSWHTLLKILPCHNFVAGGNKPKLKDLTFMCCF